MTDIGICNNNSVLIDHNDHESMDHGHRTDIVVFWTLATVLSHSKNTKQIKKCDEEKIPKKGRVVPLPFFFYG